MLLVDGCCLFVASPVFVVCGLLSVVRLLFVVGGCCVLLCIVICFLFADVCRCSLFVVGACCRCRLPSYVAGCCMVLLFCCCSSLLVIVCCCVLFDIDCFFGHVCWCSLFVVVAGCWLLLVCSGMLPFAVACYALLLCWSLLRVVGCCCLLECVVCL